MKTDTLFYTIFLDFPEIFFELINQPIEQVNDYEFTSQAVKEQSFTVAVNSAKLLINQAKTELSEPVTQKNLLNLIETIIINKLPLKTTKEIEAMLDLQDLKQTRVYQEGKEEGREEGEQQEAAKLVLRQLQRRLGDIPETVQETIRGLSVEQLEDLGIALLDFNSQSDLLNWLS